MGWVEITGNEQSAVHESIRRKFTMPRILKAHAESGDGLSARTAKVKVRTPVGDEETGTIQ